MSSDGLEWLNYHHLLYFYIVAREGTISKACSVLRLTQPTISAQIKALEDTLGEKLFTRTGNRLTLTEAGTVVFGYAEGIFSLGRELQDTLKGRPTGKPQRLRVGVSDVVPKLIAYRLIEPALRAEPQPRLVFSEDHAEQLIDSLANHALDLVLTDSPIVHASRAKLFNHFLGECSISLFATRALAARLRGDLPRSLHRQPLLVPGEGSTLRRQLDRWLDSHSVEPSIVAEFADSALMKVFGGRGEGVFPGPSAIEREICEHYSVVCVGRVSDLRERYYAISAERRIKHPAVHAIAEAARGSMFRE